MLGGFDHDSEGVKSVESAKGRSRVKVKDYKGTYDRDLYTPSQCGTN